MEVNLRQYIINFIKAYQYYADGVLEKMTDAELNEIYNSVIDWMGN